MVPPGAKGTGYAGARSGVAVADRVTGPYVYRGSSGPNAGAWPRNVRPEQKVKRAAARRATASRGASCPTSRTASTSWRRDFAGGQMARDMTLFVDDDGEAYHVYASEENTTLHISRLTDDYLTPAGDYVRVFPGRFMEAPALFKRQGRYYLIASGCTGWAPNAARSAVADSIWGPWTELGNPAVGPGAETTFGSRAPSSCRCAAGRAPSSSWSTAGGRRTRSTAGTSGCPSSSATAGSSSRGATSGTSGPSVRRSGSVREARRGGRRSAPPPPPPPTAAVPSGLGAPGVRELPAPAAVGRPGRRTQSP